MRAEREREAADERARGEEAAQRVRALADRTVVELVSDARPRGRDCPWRGRRTAQRDLCRRLWGDPEFFEFYRSLAAYQARFGCEQLDDGACRPTANSSIYLKTGGI